MVAINPQGKTMNVLLVSEAPTRSSLKLERKAKAPLQTELADFIADAKKQHRARAWLECDDLRAYVRKAQRIIEGKMITTLDIASVSVPEEKRNQGIFTEFLQMAHDMNPWDATYIENVNTDRFAEYFWKRDWELKDDTSRCFYKRKNQGSFRDAWTRARNFLTSTTN